MWPIFKKALIDHAALTIVGAVATLITIAALSVWGAVNALRTVPIYSLQNATHHKFIPLEPSPSKETELIGIPTGVRFDEGFCFLSLVGGTFGRPWERIGVYLNTEGEWLYDYRHGASKINGRIDCYRHPKLIRTN